MASPTVVTTVTGTAASGSPQTLNLPSGVTSGDMVVMSVSRDGAGGDIVFDTAGWTELVEVNGSASRQVVAARIATGSETTVDISHAVPQDVAYVGYRITGHNGDVTTASIEAASASGTSATPDPPSLNPSGWGTEDMLALVLIGVDTASARTTDPPASYSNLLVTTITNDCEAAGAQRALTAASSEDPGTFTLSTSDDWTAVTVLIRGSAAAGHPAGRRLGSIPFTRVVPHITHGWRP